MGKNLVAIRRASSLAHDAKELVVPKTFAEYVKKSKTMLEFRILSLQTELQMLNKLADLPDDEKSVFIFESLNKESNGKLPVDALFNRLRGIRGDPEFVEAVNLAINKLAAGAPKLVGESDFSVLLQNLSTLMDCTLSELACVIVTDVLFCSTLEPFTSTGNAVQAAHIAAEEKEEVLSTEASHELRRAMKDSRMMALFKIFDQRNEGVIDFKEIVVGMYKIMDDIDEASHAAVAALLFFDDTQQRVLTYVDFARLMLNITTSVPDHITFDDVADTLTLNATAVASGVTDEYALEKFSIYKASKLLLDISEHEKFFNLGLVELAKMDRLFSMFDTDHDGVIDAKDLTLGLSKFHESVGITNTVKESRHVMKEFDHSHTGSLDKQEFASFIVNFATAASLDLIHMLDFMLVVLTVKDRSGVEEEYVKAIGKYSSIDFSYG